MKNVEYVYANGDCHGCGVCAAVCPEGSITMIVDEYKCYKPVVDINKCRQCGICMQVCSGVDFPEQNNKFSSETGIGPYKSIWLGFSKEKKLRSNSSSGGIVTSIIAYLFNTKAIDCALVSRLDFNPVGPAHGVVVWNKEELFNSAKSIYSVCEISNSLKEILNNKLRYAFVGLPCHLRSLEKVFKINNHFREKCVLKIGLFEGKNISFAATDYYINRTKISADKLFYRDSGWWKYNIGVYSKNTIHKEEFKHSPIGLIWGSFICLPGRCLVCSDFSAEVSDISCGDAWLNRFSGDEKGVSAMIIRSEKAERIIQNMDKNGIINIEQANPGIIHESQCRQIDYKKRMSYLRLQLLNKNKEFPKNKENGYYNLRDKIETRLQLFFNKVSLWSIRKGYFNNTPLWVLRIIRYYPTLFNLFSKVIAKKQLTRYDYQNLFSE